MTYPQPLPEGRGVLPLPYREGEGVRYFFEIHSLEAVL
jgi:hypothetical protein